MFRSILRGQRGGVAILTSMGFLFFSVPLISGSLGLAETTTIDARVKTGIMHQDYCGLAVQEYIGYLLMDMDRWQNWLDANADLSDPGTYSQTLDLCGENIAISVAQVPPDLTEDPIDDELITIPFVAAYNQRDFQTFKTVSDSNPDGGDPVTYTITVTNRSDDATTLNEIRDTLPAGFVYDCSAPDQLTLPGMAPQDIVPSNGNGCPSGSDLDWSMPPGNSIEPGDVVTLTFTAITNDDPGTYCNEVQVVPGGDKTRSGQTAIVEIGSSGGLCPGDAVMVTQEMVAATLVYTDTFNNPYIYTFDVKYTITVENIGTVDLTLAGFIDLLPVGYSYFATDPTGDITEAPSNLHHVSQLDRQRVTWDFSPQVVVAAGETTTLKFDATGIAPHGNYWVDLLVDFAGGTFPEDLYTWPTAVVAVKDVYQVTAIDADGNENVIALQVWIEGENGMIANWGLWAD